MEPKQIFIRTLGIALVVVVVLLGAIFYVKADIDKKFLLVQQARAEMQAKGISLTELVALEDDAEKARTYAPQLDRLFTTKDQLLSFSTDIGFLAKQSGFSGTPKFREETALPTGDLKKTNFSLTIEGPKNFSDLAGFFKAVEQSSYFVHFQTVNISREGNTLQMATDGYVLSF